MGVVSAVNVLRELADEQRAALTRTMRALEILEGGEVVADAEPATTPIPSETSPVPAKADRTPAAKALATKPTSQTAMRRDLGEVAATAVAAHHAGESMAAAVAAKLNTTPGNAADLIKRAHEAGHSIPKRAAATRSAPATEVPMPAAPAGPWRPGTGAMLLGAVDGAA